MLTSIITNRHHHIVIPIIAISDIKSDVRYVMAIFLKIIHTIHLEYVYTVVELMVDTNKETTFQK